MKYLSAIWLALALALASVGVTFAQVPTPPGPLLDSSQIIGDAWVFMPFVTDPLTTFVALSIAISVGLLILRVARSMGRGK